LNPRALPAWFDDAKFGIFVHWGLFAVPAFASGKGPIGEAFRADYDRAVAVTPYAEWYANAIKVPGTPSADFHQRRFGGAPYAAFKDAFMAGLGDWDPAAWARIFRQAGARHVVMVTKHHDGFCLWPSAVANPRQDGWTSPRDLVGELAAAVRAEGLRFGVYYSGGIDWSFNPEPLRTLADFLGSTPGGAYPAYAEAQVRELIARYAPDVLWNDIAWPTSQRRLERLFDDYYAAAPEGVVNDRWTTANPARRALRFRAARRRLDDRIKARIAADPTAFDGFMPTPVPHCDFTTPEYARFAATQDKKWEATRGISHSFGFNRNDTEADYASAETLIGELIDATAKNGGLLLNVGPQAGGAIPVPQRQRLAAIGAWLRVNGAAIYGARPWIRAEAVTEAGSPVRFTASRDAVNVIVLGGPKGETLRIKNLSLAGRGRHLATGATVTLSADAGDTLLDFAQPLKGDFGPAISVSS
jgi:alpha-L-fucosidase